MPVSCISYQWWRMYVQTVVPELVRIQRKLNMSRNETVKVFEKKSVINVQESNILRWAQLWSDLKINALNTVARVSSHNHLHSTVNHNNGRVVSHAKAVNRGAPHVPSPSPAMVLDDSHIVTRELCNFITGEVKQFSSINNLRVLLANEGFPNVKVAYLGGLWVMLDLESSISKKKLMEHVEVAKIGTKWGEVMDLEESNDDMFARKRICIKTKQEDNILEKFKIIVRGKFFVIRAKDLFAWSPNFKNTNEPVYSSDDESAEGDIADKGDASKIANSGVGSDAEDLNGFDQMVSNTWNSFTLDDSNAMIRFKKKLQLMKKAIRLWVASYNRDQTHTVREIKMKLHDIDKELDQGGVNNEILLSRKDLMKQLQDVKYLETSDYAQKTKIQWAIEGDENSKFYHAPGSSRGRLNFLFSNRLSHKQAADLEIPITHDEIRAAVWDCGENKSPGLDGFTFEFFRNYWSIVGIDFCEAVDWFFQQGSFAKGCNFSFLALIPKLQDPKVVSDFRPISLIGCLYKVVTKADFAKAYDYVRWDFLDDVLNAFGFGRKWRSWISGSRSASMASILINGSPTFEFQFYRGLKQGDPLDPFLFILVMESLHLSFNKATEAGLFKGIKLDSSLSISYLFYADDAVFIEEWSDLNITHILHILHCFSIASGLKINLLKSHILGVGVPLEKVNDATFSLVCSVMRAPFKYLGVSVGGNMSLIKEWNVIINKLHSRLSKWKCNVLSVGGRLTLHKSILGSTPIYTILPRSRVPLSVKFTSSNCKESIYFLTFVFVLEMAL
nr:RNA-directed DNA polymerase, eukaryota [Tanacetum cinerariifolium]